MAFVDEILQRRLHRLEFSDLVLDILDPPLGQDLHVSTGSAAIAIEIEQLAAFLDHEAERARPLHELQEMQVLFVIVTIAVFLATAGLDQANILVIADCLGRKSAFTGHFTNVH